MFDDPHQRLTNSYYHKTGSMTGPHRDKQTWTPALTPTVTIGGVSRTTFLNHEYPWKTFHHMETFKLHT